MRSFKNIRKSKSLNRRRKQSKKVRRSVRRNRSKSISAQIGGFVRDVTRVVTGNFRSTSIVPNISCS
tara:strand:- start:1179 stop:1379 length:201 start_codon:yes stop_codon:yes gene_type:complete